MLNGVPPELQHDLERVVGGQVRFDAATRAMYSADASNHRRVPIGVVAPRDAADVEATLAVCREHGAPVLPLGARTSIAGQAVNAAVALDFTRHLTRVVELDPDARTARVQPGVVCDALRAAARPHGLTFGPDPSTHDRCTFGGMIGNNACGSHSVAWGKTADNVVALDVLTYRGERVDTRVGSRIAGELRALHDRQADAIRDGFPQLTRRVSGYNLDALPDVAKALVGTEGTCAVTLEATVALVEAPPVRALAVLGFPDAYTAADHAPAVRELAPLTIEGMDAGLIAALRAAHPNETASRALPEGGGWLYVETGGATVAEAEAAARAAARLAPTSTVVSDPAHMRALWRIREDGAGIVTRSPDGGEAWPGWEDAAVPPSRLGAYLREFDALLARHGRRGAYYGHFGDGCLHVRIDFDLLTHSGIAAYRTFLEEAADLVVGHGGSLSGEHGDGAARAELLPRMYPAPVIRAFEEFKGIWDPDGRMNPDRVVRPAKLDEDLRVFVGLPTIRDAPQLAFAQDRGSFTRATRRCLGVARCVTASGGVMCPSYRATGAEMHSTRGRARLLFEMASGQVVEGGWRSGAVAEALDLCLSCKACKRDCPVGVDMAAYKTEFLAQRYRLRLRPRAHYALGALPRWLRLLPTTARGAVNALACSPLAGALKRMAGIAAQRPIPQLAPRPFTRRPVDRKATFTPMDGSNVAFLPTAAAPRGRLLLWPDTFTDHFDPSIAADAVAVLTSLGYAVELPPRPVCCGLTWTTTGQVAAARRVLRRSLRTIEPWIVAGVPVVGLEPSCTAALRADVAELLPGDPLAARLQVRTFAEVLADHLDELRERATAPPRRAEPGVAGPLGAAEPGTADPPRTVDPSRAAEPGTADGPGATEPGTADRPGVTEPGAADPPRTVDPSRATEPGTADRPGGPHRSDRPPAGSSPRRRALVQVHCHQHADLGFAADTAVLDALGVDAEVLDSGCCGLAGNFGFEHYEVSMACAERVLLPAVRGARPDVDVLADGFSCRTQLRQACAREPVHLAQVAARAIADPA